MRYIYGAFIASLLLIASYVYGPSLLGRLLSRGDSTEWQDVAKSPQYRYWNGGVPVAQNPR